jgi:hypothetical protein
MSTSKYSEGEKVTCINLGSSFADKRYRGVIRGLAIDGPARFYIVEMVDKFRTDVYPYSCCSMIESCLCKGWV